jgi:hypothetical protein
VAVVVADDVACRRLEVAEPGQSLPQRAIAAAHDAVYWPRDRGSTPAKVRKSLIAKVPRLAGSVGRQRGCIAR